MAVWDDERLALTAKESLTFSFMPPDQAATLVRYMIVNRFFGVDMDYGPEPALTTFLNIYNHLSEPTNTMIN